MEAAVYEPNYFSYFRAMILVFLLTNYHCKEMQKLILKTNNECKPVEQWFQDGWVC